MSPILLARGLVGVSALALALNALNAAQATPDPLTAGQAIVWGVTGAETPALPAEITNTPIVQVAAVGQNAALLTATGEVVMRVDQDDFQRPDSLQGRQVVSLEAANGTFAAVTADGNAVLWGNGGPAQTPGSTDVTDLTDVELGNAHGTGLKRNGTVVAWGDNTNGETAVPDGLSGVTKIAGGSDFTYALKDDGTVVGWGKSTTALTQMPAALATPGKVKDIAARADGGLALLDDNTVVSWGNKATSGLGAKFHLPPASLAGKTITTISTGPAQNLAIDAEGVITVWGSTSNTPTDVPAALDGRTLTDVVVTNNYAYAVQSKVMQITGSSVSGTAKQGQTLTGTPATFSGSPEVSYQWLAGTTPIAGATTSSLTLTAAQVGKQLTFRTIATKNGESLTSDSPATASVAPATVPKVTSRTTISKVKVKRKTAAFSVKVTRAGGTPTGKVKVLVKRGAKKVYSKTLTLKSGVAKVSLKRLKKGKHKITATYAGDSRSKPSTAKAQTFRVK